MSKVREQIPYKMLNGVAHGITPCVCHGCGRGPYLIPLDGDHARRKCSRCELTYYLCQSCRNRNLQFPPILVNDDVVRLATGERKVWYCEDCWDEIGYY